MLPRRELKIADSPRAHIIASRENGSRDSAGGWHRQFATIKRSSAVAVEVSDGRVLCVYLHVPGNLRVGGVCIA